MGAGTRLLEQLMTTLGPESHLPSLPPQPSAPPVEPRPPGSQSRGVVFPLPGAPAIRSPHIGLDLHPQGWELRRQRRERGLLHGTLGSWQGYSLGCPHPVAAPTLLLPLPPGQTPICGLGQCFRASGVWEEGDKTAYAVGGGLGQVAPRLLAVRQIPPMAKGRAQQEQPTFTPACGRG